MYTKNDEFKESWSVDTSKDSENRDKFLQLFYIKFGGSNFTTRYCGWSKKGIDTNGACYISQLHTQDTEVVSYEEGIRLLSIVN